jgi:hypothetical protein
VSPYLCTTAFESDNSDTIYVVRTELIADLGHYTMIILAKPGCCLLQMAWTTGFLQRSRDALHSYQLNGHFSLLQVDQRHGHIIGLLSEGINPGLWATIFRQHVVFQ